MSYPILPKVYTSGIAETGLTAVVNDKTTKLKVPWAVSQTGDKNIEWEITNAEGDVYKITVPVKIEVSGSTTTVTYTQGRYTRQAVT